REDEDDRLRGADLVQAADMLLDVASPCPRVSRVGGRGRRALVARKLAGEHAVPVDERDGRPHLRIPRVRLGCTSRRVLGSSEITWAWLRTRASERSFTVMSGRRRIRASAAGPRSTIW